VIKKNVEVDQLYCLLLEVLLLLEALYLINYSQHDQLLEMIKKFDMDVQQGVVFLFTNPLPRPKRPL
jgi:hypothetical protein